MAAKKKAKKKAAKKKAAKKTSEPKVLETIEELLEMLANTDDQVEKRKIRAKLRNRGHVGGIRSTKAEGATPKKAAKKKGKKKAAKKKAARRKPRKTADEDDE